MHVVLTNVEPLDTLTKNCYALYQKICELANAGQIKFSHTHSQQQPQYLMAQRPTSQYQEQTANMLPQQYPVQ